MRHPISNTSTPHWVARYRLLLLKGEKQKMGENHGKNSNYVRGVRNLLRRGCLGAVCVFTSCAPLTCTSAGKFGVSDLEKTGDVRAALAICYRAQKDNGAAGGGNTRNCDSLQDEFIRWQRFDVCKDIYSDDKKHCLCQVYKICAAN